MGRHSKPIEFKRYSGHGCEVCGKHDSQKPMCFRGVPWCCEIHRKVVFGELTPEQGERAMRGEKVRESEVMG